jgi:transposase InsO family protein
MSQHTVTIEREEATSCGNFWACCCAKTAASLTSLPPSTLPPTRVATKAPRSKKWSCSSYAPLMKAMGACLVQGERPEPLPRLGTVTVEQPNRRWATDFTTVWTKEDGVVAVVPVIDCGWGVMPRFVM